VTSNTRSTLLAHIPGSALAVIDQSAVGASIRTMVDRLRSCDPALAESLKQVDQAVGLLGGWDALLGWVGETAFVVDRDGANPTGGVLVAPKSRADADRLATQVKNAITLAGGSMGVSTRDETHANQTVTVVTLTQAEASLPELAFTVSDAYVAIGPKAWVERVIDTTDATSLGADARFSNALGRVEAEHVGLMYANIAGIRDLVESSVPSGDAKTRYETDVRPYLLPFDAAISTSTVSGDVDRFHSLVIVK
jgi:hypothetical protein